MERISRSWSLVRSSWAVLRQDRELLLYTIASGLSGIFNIALYRYADGERAFRAKGGSNQGA